MVYTVTGANAYKRQQRLDALKQAFVSAYTDMGLEAIDVSEWSVAQVTDTFSAMPFLVERRLLLVQGFAENKLLHQHVVTLLQAPADLTDVVLHIPKIDKRSAMYKQLKKLTQFEEFAEQDPATAPQFAQAEAKTLGAILSLADARYLVQRVGSNQSTLLQEIKKLVIYNKTIDRNSIDALTEPTPQSTIFELLESAFMGNISQALRLYEDQRAQQVEPLAIEAMFVWQLHIVLLAKAAGNKPAESIAADAGLSPFVVKKSASLASKKTTLQIRKYVLELAQLEQAIKSTSVSADELLKNYIVRLAA